MKIAIVAAVVLALGSPALAATTPDAPAYKLTVPFSISNIDKTYGYVAVECRLSSSDDPPVANLPQIFAAAAADKLTPAVVPISAGSATFAFGLPASPAIHSAICQLLGFASAKNDRPKPLSDFPLSSSTQYVSVKIPAPAPTPSASPTGKFDVKKNQSS